MTDERLTEELLFNQYQENQLNEQIESERSANATMPAGLFALMIAPLLLIAIPLVLLWVLRSSPTNAPLEQPAAAVTSERATAETASPSPVGPSVAWQTSFHEALTLAQQTGKPIMADFYTDWCGPCKAMDAYTWTDPSIVEESKNVIPVKINADNFQDIAQQYSVTGYPTIIWMNSQGHEKGRNDGAVGPQDMLLLMQKFR